ncbi:MAG: SLBB domain-containing protein [Burkholderiales bacterium]|nr:SLBB domain-containing protein [Burkholderiales bacterium]MDE2396799.1 SLBB domain-containing protein [Burkholderiales bacterium]MDE2456978.1 SLBB domain-containing protein [Burkholderiales bacterium]
MHRSIPFRSIAARVRKALHAVPALLALAVCLPHGAHAQSADLPDPSNTSPTGGPIQLRQSSQSSSQSSTANETRQNTGQQPFGIDENGVAVTRSRPYQPSQFELYVQGLVDAMRHPAGSTADFQDQGQGRDRSRAATGQNNLQQLPKPNPYRVRIRRLGADLETGDSASAYAASDVNPMVPADYLLQSGDEVVLTLWGSVEADLRLTVDRTGRISVPRVGPIMVAGVRYGDLSGTISRQVAQTFKNFKLSVALGRLRGVRVYVTGFVTHPGAIVTSSLSTLSQALLRAGGPSSAGSFRDIQLRRGNRTISTFDFYDLLVYGNRSGDVVVQPDDVIYVGPIGPQVALIGSVNRPGVFEIKNGEGIDDVLRMAGGLSAVADTSQLTIEPMDQRSAARVVRLSLPLEDHTVLHSGDVLRAFDQVELVQPVQRQNKRVTVDGEVVHPGEYVLPPDSSVDDAIRAAGGLTSAAFVYGTEFTRESVRQSQQVNYDRALRDLETDLAGQLTAQGANPADTSAEAAKARANDRLLQRLREQRPTGRIVLQIAPDGDHLPNLTLESGDRIYIPSRPTSVGVFGNVFNSGSYLYSANRNVDQYLRLAGGPRRTADSESTFVVHANGSVVSNLQGKSWFGPGNKLAQTPAQPGDTIFVPNNLEYSPFIQGAKDWTQILYQFGLGLAGLRAATK